MRSRRGRVRCLPYPISSSGSVLEEVEDGDREFLRTFVTVDISRRRTQNRIPLRTRGGVSPTEECQRLGQGRTEETFGGYTRSHGGWSFRIRELRCPWSQFEGLLEGGTSPVGETWDRRQSRRRS